MMRGMLFSLLCKQALRKTVVPSPIAQWECYDYTNESEGKDVLRDLTGNGHDIQLYNFDWSEESGYNKSTYKGALVSDGVDDYGLCENFPILTKEKGYTVCAIRKILNGIDVNSCFINQGDSKNWSFAIDLFYLSTHNVRNWSGNIGIGKDKPNYLFVYQNSKTYNGIKDLTIGDNEGLSQNLNLFALTANYFPMSAAFYAMDIYGEDFTSEQIAKVKEKMIKRYEEKTGETYVEEVTA